MLQDKPSLEWTTTSRRCTLKLRLTAGQRGGALVSVGDEQRRGWNTAFPGADPRPWTALGR